MPYQSLFNAVSTYKGRLVLNLGYDAGKLAEETARQLAAGIRGALEGALDADGPPVAPTRS
jgi:hypothetical protein